MALTARTDSNGNVVAFVPKQRDRATERAMVDAGYMTLREYIERWEPQTFAQIVEGEQARVKHAMAEG